MCTEEADSTKVGTFTLQDMAKAQLLEFMSFSILFVVALFSFVLFNFACPHMTSVS